MPDIDIITPEKFDTVRKDRLKDKVDNLVKIINTGLSKGQNRFHFPSEMKEVIHDAVNVFESLGFKTFEEEYLLFYGKPHTEVILATSKDERDKLIEAKRFREWLLTTKDGKEAQRSVSNRSVQAQHNLLLRMYRKQCV